MREPSFGLCTGGWQQLWVYHGWCWAQQAEKGKHFNFYTILFLTDSFFFCFVLADIKLGSLRQRQKSLKRRQKNQDNYFHWQTFLSSIRMSISSFARLATNAAVNVHVCTSEGLEKSYCLPTEHSLPCTFRVAIPWLFWCLSFLTRGSSGSGIMVRRCPAQALLLCCFWKCLSLVQG